MVDLPLDPSEAGWDLGAANELYPSVNFAQGVGRAFSEAEALLNAYDAEDDALARAVIRAIVDWHRICGGEPTLEHLRACIRCYLADAVVTSNDLDNAIQRANLPIGESTRLLSTTEGSPRGPFRANELLVEHDEGYTPQGRFRPIPDAMWSEAAGASSASTVILIATNAELRGLPDLAGAIWTHVISRGDADAEQIALGYVHRGGLAALSGRYDEAKADLTEAIGLKGISGETRGRCYLARAQARWLAEGYTKTAAADFGRALERLDDVDLRATAYVQRGAIRAETESTLTEAASDYTAALNLPNVSPAIRAWAYTNRGLVRFQLSDLAEAEADYTAAIGTRGAAAQHLAQAFYDRGAIRAHQPGREEEAEADFTAAIQHDKDNADRLAASFHNRATTRNGLGRDPADVDADYSAAIAILTESLNRADAMLHPSRMAMSQWSDVDRLANAYLMRSLVRGQQRREPMLAESDCTAVIALRDAAPDLRAKAWNNRGAFRMNLRRPLAAEADYTSAATTAGANPAIVADALVNRADLRASVFSRYGDAARDYQDALGLEETDPQTRCRAYVSLGIIRAEHLGQRREAEEDFTVAIGVEGSGEGRWRAYLNRSRLRMSEGRCGEAEEDLRAMIEARIGHFSTTAAGELGDLLHREQRFADDAQLWLELLHRKDADMRALALRRVRNTLIGRLGLQLWEPGAHGRGVLYQAACPRRCRRLLTWKTGTDGSPFHPEVVAAARIPFRSIVAILVIDTAGSYDITAGPDDDTAEIVDSVLAADGRLQAVKHDRT